MELKFFVWLILLASFAFALYYLFVHTHDSALEEAEKKVEKTLEPFWDPMAKPVLEEVAVEKPVEEPKKQALTIKPVVPKGAAVTATAAKKPANKKRHYNRKPKAPKV